MSSSTDHYAASKRLDDMAKESGIQIARYQNPLDMTKTHVKTNPKEIEKMSRSLDDLLVQEINPFEDQIEYGSSLLDPKNNDNSGNFRQKQNQQQQNQQGPQQNQQNQLQNQQEKKDSFRGLLNSKISSPEHILPYTASDKDNDKDNSIKNTGIPTETQKSTPSLKSTTLQNTNPTPKFTTPLKSALKNTNSTNASLKLSTQVKPSSSSASLASSTSLASQHTQTSTKHTQITQHLSHNNSNNDDNYSFQEKNGEKNGKAVENYSFQEKNEKIIENYSFQEKNSKAAEFYEIIESKLVPELSFYQKKRESTARTLHDLEQLLDTIHGLQIAQNAGQKTTECKVNLGCKIFAEAKFVNVGKIIIDIGLGFFIEVTYNEANNILKQRCLYLRSSLSNLEKQCCFFSSRIKGMYEAIGVLTEITQGKEEKQQLRDIWG